MNKKQIILITIIAVVVIAGLIFGGKVLADQQAQKKIDDIHAAYTEAIEANISAYLGRSESEMSIDQKMYGITDVTFEVDGIFFEKENQQHIISVTAYVQTASTALDETQHSLVSYDVERSCLTLAEKNGLSGDFRLAGNTCSYYPSGSISGNTLSMSDPLVTVYVNGNLSHAPETTLVEVSRDKDTVKCQSCGNKYNKGSDNAKSITRTNMCKSCYGSYKTMSDALNDMPVK